MRKSTLLFFTLIIFSSHFSSSASAVVKSEATTLFDWSSFDVNGDITEISRETGFRVNSVSWTTSPDWGYLYEAVNTPGYAMEGLATPTTLKASVNTVSKGSVFQSFQWVERTLRFTAASQGFITVSGDYYLAISGDKDPVDVGSENSTLSSIDLRLTNQTEHSADSDFYRLWSAELGSFDTSDPFSNTANGTASKQLFFNSGDTGEVIVREWAWIFNSGEFSLDSASPYTNPTVTPEPATMALFGIGGAALAATRRRKAKKSKRNV